MKRFLLAILTLLLFPSVAFAQTSMDMPASDNSLIAPAPNQKTPFLGQNHAYTVVLRGNSEAVVSARIILTNTKDTPQREVEMRLPEKVQTGEVVAYQVIREDRPCLVYENQTNPTINYRPICKEYGEVDYYQFYGQNKYQKAKVDLSADMVKITLPVAVAPNASGAYFIYFRTNSFVSKDIFGVMNYKFETLKVGDAIQNMSVGISTDSDLALKGAMGEVNYRFEDQARSFGALEAQKAVASPALDNFYGQIGYGSINKMSSNLAPLESYIVTGAYAKNKISLYAKEVLIGLFLLALFIIVVAVVGRILYRRVTGVVKAENITRNSSFLVVFFASLSSTFLVGLYTGLLILSFKLLEQTGVPYYGYYSEFMNFAWLLIAVVSFAVYILLIVAPSVFIGARRGIGWGLVNFGLTVFWLVILIFVFIAVVFLTQRSGEVYPATLRGDSGAVQTLEK